MVHTFTYGYSATSVLLKLHNFTVPLSPLLVPFLKGEGGVSSVRDTVHLVPCLPTHPGIFGGDVLFISRIRRLGKPSTLGLPFVAIFSSLDVQLLRFLTPWWSWCSHMYVK